MKKILFVIPLMTMSFLVSCNKKSVSTLPTKCSLYMRINNSILLIAEKSFEYNDNGLLIKDILQFTQADGSDIHEYEYDEKGNITKDTETRMEGGEIVDGPYVTNYTYTYDENDRITKEVVKGESIEQISDYTYESDLVYWKTFKFTDSGAVVKDVTRTFKNGLYEKAVDSKKDEYYYYTWDEYQCNTKIETYCDEEKIPTNHVSDETYEYHKNMSNKVKKYVTTYYNSGEIESNETLLTEYDSHDRKIKMSDYDEQIINSYWVYEYKD